MSGGTMYDCMYVCMYACVFVNLFTVIPILKGTRWVSAGTMCECMYVCMRIRMYVHFDPYLERDEVDVSRYNV